MHSTNTGASTFPVLAIDSLPGKHVKRKRTTRDVAQRKSDLENFRSNSEALGFLKSPDTRPILAESMIL
jgi:hypothetical protein